MTYIIMETLQQISRAIKRVLVVMPSIIPEPWVGKYEKS